MKFKMLINIEIAKIDGIFRFNSLEPVIILLINVKMPTIVGISTFMSRINFMLSWDENEKSFITSGTGFCIFRKQSCLSAVPSSRLISTSVLLLVSALSHF